MLNLHVDAESLIDFDDLVSELDNPDSDTNSYKLALSAGRERIQNTYSDCNDAWLAIAARTCLVDNVLIHSWQTRFSTDDCALVAVGGYGRGELHPYSDIDLMVLTGESLSDATENSISEFVTSLWDLGLDIGHSVRSVSQCIEQSKNDITVITNLMESRLLCGARALFDNMLQNTREEIIWNGDDFFRGKREEQRQRHIRFQDTSYRLEPNVKESPGGIRDIQTIRWIAQRYFGSSDFQVLVDHDILDAEELKTLRNGEDLLCKVRFLLHNTAGRREDRLLFDHQRQLAHAFGFTVDENNQCIEEFMQGYYRTVMALERLNEMLLRLFDEGLPENREKNTITAINERFQVNNNHIEVTDNAVFERYPPALLELFYLISQDATIEGVRANTIRLVRRNLHLIDDKFREHPESKRLFIAILEKCSGVTHQLRRMNRYGVLAAYLPAFEKIVGRMQYDLFHIFTVDEHTLMVIRNMRRFCLDKHRDEVPHCNDVMESVDKPELLFLMGLFHDIAKGRGGDHSELGAQDAWDFCVGHGLSTVDSGLVQWAVANHLIMSMTIQRRDISDPEVVHAFAQRVSSKTHLDYLYMLTVADIRGTNPELWNSWKDSLLKTLYQATLAVLNRGLDNPLNKMEIIEENKRDALNRLQDEDVDTAAVQRLWADMGEDYFLRYYADEISWHTPEIIRHEAAESETPLVLIRQDTRYNSTEIFIYCADQERLFALITMVIGNLELNIISARIVTSNKQYALDRFRVLDKSGSAIKDKYRLEQIRSSLEAALSRPDSVARLQPRSPTRRLKNFNIAVSVEFDNEVTAGLTSVAVTATDRPGALAKIAWSFYECGVSVHAAKVATFGEKLEDVFFISQPDGRQVTDEKLLSRIENLLIEQLSA